MQLRSAYDSYKSGNVSSKPDYAENHPDFTVYTKEFIGTLDYLLYSSKHFKVSSVLNVPTHDPEVKSSKLPNKTYPSDHFKIAARFTFK